MTQVTFVTGLPGSGKTTYAKKVVSETGATFFNDYKNKSINDNPALCMSPQYQKLIGALKNGLDCIVTDVDFYKSAARREATEDLKARFGERIDIRWVFFERDIEACVQNVCYRALEEEPEKKKRGLSSIGAIFAYAVVGDVPTDANVLPVWSDKQRSLIPKTAFTNEQLFEVVHFLHNGFHELEAAAQKSLLDSAKALTTLELVLRSFLQQFEST